VPDGQAVAKAMEIAEVVAENAPLSVQAVLRSLREGAEMSEADALANELTHGWPIFATADAKEGATAFKEKRKANFQGK
jgi:enoyl-CoA hydratase